MLVQVAGNRPLLNVSHEILRIAAEFAGNFGRMDGWRLAGSCHHPQTWLAQSDWGAADPTPCTGIIWSAGGKPCKKWHRNYAIWHISMLKQFRQALPLLKSTRVLLWGAPCYRNHFKSLKMTQHDTFNNDKSKDLLDLFTSCRGGAWAVGASKLEDTCKGSENLHFSKNAQLPRKARENHDDASDSSLDLIASLKPTPAKTI